MTSQQAVSSEYDARIKRAEKLIAEKSSASELLSFYRRIAGFQKNLLAQIARRPRYGRKLSRFGSIRDSLDLTLLLPHFRSFLSVVEQNAPNALAAAARELAVMTSDSWVALLSGYWKNGGAFRPADWSVRTVFFAGISATLRRVRRGRTAVPPVLVTPRVCPLVRAGSRCLEYCDSKATEESDS